jgi:tetratricopeptide (TPR) repeat protein
VAPFAVQLLLGAFAAPLVYVIAARAVRPVTALLAALAIAGFAPLVFFEALYLVEGLVLLSLTAAIAAGVGLGKPVHAAVLAGAALGVAVLGRGSNLLVALPLAAWFLWGRASGGLPGRRRAALAFLLTLAAVLTPLLLHNLSRAGRPFLLTANAGFNLYIGNGPDATGIFVRVPGLDLQQDPLTLRYVQRRVHRPVTASAVNDYWNARTRAWVRTHPGRTLQLFLWKLLLFWNRLSIPQVEGFESAAAGTVLAQAPYWRSFAFLPLALVGVAVALVSWVRRARRGELDATARVRAFLAACAVAYSISIAFFFITDRYRVPILPVLIVLAACTVEGLAATSARGRRRWLPAAALVVTTAFALTDPGLLGVDERRMRRDLYVHAALRFAAAEQFDAAVGAYRRALGLDPEDAEVRDGMARMLARAGEDSLALLQYRALLHDRPDHAVSWYNYGNLLRRLGRRTAALDAYRRSAALDSTREAVWNQMGEVQRAAGDTVQAAASYRRALAIAPAYEQALNNLAALRATQGDAHAAEAGWRAALAANPRYLPALQNLAVLLGDSGRSDEALVYWKRAVAIDPDNETARRMVLEQEPGAVLPAATKRREAAARGAGADAP